MAHFFGYLQAEHPQVTCCAAVTPAHAKGFIVAHAVREAHLLRRGRHKGSGEQTTTAHSWLVDVRGFFADLCAWATEPDSPFAGRGALLELLLSSGLRVEEACELTTSDVLKRALPDGRLYYLLHVQLSKLGRARVIPIWDQLGRVIADIIRHVRAFYGADAVPPCDRRDEHEKRPLPRAPYLLQGRTHPSTLNTNTIRGRLRALSLVAGARHGDGTPLELTPHDGRRVFGSEQLNQLYPSEVVECYRRAMRGLTATSTDPRGTRALTAEEWAAFTASCSLRDVGTARVRAAHGEHPPRGLVCLGCGHAQPKKSAVPTFRRMLASHSRARWTGPARSASPPANSPPGSSRWNGSAARCGARRSSATMRGRPRWKPPRSDSIGP